MTIALQNDRLLISRFQVRVLGGSPMSRIEQHPAGFASPVTWAVAPEWLTPLEAAELLGRNYTADTIWSLIGISAVVWEVVDGEVLIETASLEEYQEATLDIS